MHGWHTGQESAVDVQIRHSGGPYFLEPQYDICDLVTSRNGVERRRCGFELTLRRDVQIDVELYGDLWTIHRHWQEALRQ